MIRWQEIKGKPRGEGRRAAETLAISTEGPASLSSLSASSVHRPHLRSQPGSRQHQLQRARPDLRMSPRAPLLSGTGRADLGERPAGCRGPGGLHLPARAELTTTERSPMASPGRASELPDGCPHAACWARRPTSGSHPSVRAHGAQSTKDRAEVGPFTDPAAGDAQARWVRPALASKQDPTLSSSLESLGHDSDFTHQVKLLRGDNPEFGNHDPFHPNSLLVIINYFMTAKK